MNINMCNLCVQCRGKRDNNEGKHPIFLKEVIKKIFSGKNFALGFSVDHCIREKRFKPHGRYSQEQGERHLYAGKLKKINHLLHRRS